MYVSHVQCEDSMNNSRTPLQTLRSLFLIGCLYVFCIKAKEFVKDPSKFAVAAAASAPKAAEAEPAKKVEDKKVEEEEESGDEDMGFGLFD